MAQQDMDFKQQRQDMVAYQLRARDIKDAKVLAVMNELPRELFVDSPLRSQAYSDGPLPINRGQTISQPYMQALMTQCLRLTGSEKILEIGTGSGYQTAILARLAAEVYTIELWPELAREAQKRLDALHLQKIHYRIGDGSEGLPEAAPFDCILITAACPALPEPLLQQMAEDARLVAPVGTRDTQDLIVLTKKAGQTVRQIVCPCRFVPLLGKYAFN